MHEGSRWSEKSKAVESDPSQAKEDGNTYLVDKTIFAGVNGGTTNVLMIRTGYEIIHCELGVTPVGRPTLCAKKDLPRCNALGRQGCNRGIPGNLPKACSVGASQGSFMISVGLYARS